jgi:hypothetical protein
MEIVVWLKTIEAWLLLLTVAVANGGLRVGVLIPRFGDYRAHLASTVMLTVLIVCITMPLIDWIGIASCPGALTVGIVWTVLTLAFEFLAGHYLFGNPWARLLTDYDVLHGRIWVVVLVATLVSPLWAIDRHHR